MTISKEVQEHNQKFPSVEDMYETAVVGQNAILIKMFDAGVPLHYEDENGNDVQENPDGTIDILTESNQPKITDFPKSIRNQAREKAYNKPSLILVCGCNGAGKSTFRNTILNRNQDFTYIDPDQIAKDNNCSPMDAGRVALTRTKQFLDEGRSFLKESTLSSKSDLKLVETAKNKGFKVDLVYIGLKSADSAIKRVKDRHQGGGHSVPEEDIRRRYDRSHENLPEAIQLTDYAKIIDNTGNSYKHIATFKNGGIESQEEFPNWFKQIAEKKRIKI